MNDLKRDPDIFLPHGEMLRSYLAQPFIGKNDLKSMLRDRGVFCSQNEKIDSIPILITTILTPDEFDKIRECHNTKEDNPKVLTRTFEWPSDITLIESLPDSLDLNKIINLDFSNYKVVGSPNFATVNGDLNHVKLEFQIERTDKSKNWSTHQAYFTGSIEIYKKQNKNRATFVITHTANETKQVANITSAYLIKEFKENGLLKSHHDIEKILFSNFNNAQRIKFLFEISEIKNSSIIEFNDTVDVGLTPDKARTLPSEICWMEEKIKDLEIKGTSLHKMPFFENKHNHDYLSMYRVDTQYKFTINNITGYCIISTGFPEFSQTRDISSELEVNIKNISTEKQITAQNRSEIKLSLLKEINDKKIDIYNNIN